jgi:hypothetical protein
MTMIFIRRVSYIRSASTNSSFCSRPSADLSVDCVSGNPNQDATDFVMTCNTLGDCTVFESLPIITNNCPRVSGAAFAYVEYVCLPREYDQESSVLVARDKQ